MKLHAICIATCSTILLATACSDSSGPRIDKLQEALAQSKLSLRESVVTGQGSVTGSKAIKAELLVEGAPEFSVGALGNGTMHDVRINIVSGAVTAARTLGASADPCPGSISVEAAIPVAEAKVNGKAVRIEPDDDDHCLREVQVLSGTTLWEVKLTRDGKVLEVEKSDGNDD